MAFVFRVDITFFFFAIGPFGQTAYITTTPQHTIDMSSQAPPSPAGEGQHRAESIDIAAGRLRGHVLAHYEQFDLSSQSPPSVADGNPPVIHNKLYCEQLKIRLQRMEGPGHHDGDSDRHHHQHHRAEPLESSSSSSLVLLKLKSDDLKLVKLHTELAATANGVRMLARNLAKATIQLDVRAIMVVTKARDNLLIYLTREVAEWLLTREREITVYVDTKLKTLSRFDADKLTREVPRAKQLLRYWTKKFALRNPELFDLVVTLGGDGTVLYVSNLFQRVVPPVLSFLLGLLGFLTNFKFDQFREKMSLAIDHGVRAYLRMRFTCRVHKSNGKLVCEQQVLNELVVDRGPSPYVTQLELYGDGSLLTVAQADGLIIATPTGSTAYSLSAGGSLVHPGVSAISVTPICPHTLSFRPILLPDGMLLKVKVPKTSRSTAWASFDGKVRTELHKGDYVTIQASPFPFPTVISSKTEYVDSVSRNLNWNARETQKPLTSLKQQAKAARVLDEGTTQPDIHTHDDTTEMEDIDGAAEDDDIEDESEDGHFDIDTDSSEEFDEHDALEQERERFEALSVQPPNTASATSLSSLSSDEDLLPYLPDTSSALNTPPPKSNFPFEERTCFAHPNARITLND